MSTIEVISGCPLPDQKAKREPKYPFSKMSNIGDGFRLDYFDNKKSNNIRAAANQYARKFPVGERPQFVVRKNVNETGNVGTMVTRIK